MSKATLIVLGGVLGYAVFRWGGVQLAVQYEFLLALGLLAMVYSLARRRHPSAPLPGRALRWAAALLPAYVLLQAVPLPLALLRVASPLRALAVHTLEPIGVKPSFAPLSVSPAATFQHFLLLCGYVAVFLLVRELTLHFGAIPLARSGRRGNTPPYSGRRDQPEATLGAEENRRWIMIAPIVTLGALEAGLGLWQNLGRTGEAAQWGTYVNHNHYAGFLEMALPFAVMYPVALLRRARLRGNPSLAPSLAACGVWGLAAVMLAGIANSLSRMGFIATLGSALVMGTLAFGNRPLGWLKSSRKRRWGAAGMLAMVLLAGFAFLPSERLILRFAELTSSDPTGGGRARLWAATIPLIKAYPVFGCGLGGYETAFLKFKAFDPLVRDDFAHNDYLQLLAELGLAGFAILAVPACSLVMSTLRKAAVSQDPEGRYFAVACAGALAAILLHSLADFNLYIPANAMLLAWIAGMTPEARPPSAILSRWEQLASGPAQRLRAA